MKKRLLTTSWLMLLASVFAITTMAQSVTVQVSSDVDLYDALEAQSIDDFSTVKDLTVTGTLGDADFNLIRNQLTNLENVDISGTDIQEIPSQAFYNKGNLKTVRLPEGIYSIKNNAFNTCQQLESVTFGSQTATPGKIVFPSSLRYLEYNVFYYCTSLTHLDFSACTVLEYIGSSAFSNAYNITEVLLPSQGYLRLEGGCFEAGQIYDEASNQYIYKGLETLTLTKAVTYLSGNCLPQQTLKTLYVESSTPPSCDDYTFDSFSGSDFTVYIPKGSKKKYRTANGWSNISQSSLLESGFQVTISGYGSLQKGSTTYVNGDAFFATQGGATTLKLVPDKDNEWTAVKLDDTAINVDNDGTFTIPEGTTTGTLDISFTSNLPTIDNPNGGQLKDLITEFNSDPSTIRGIKVVGKMATKDWSFVKENMPALEEFDISETDLKTIPDQALQYHQKLAIIHLPSTVTSIGNSAFNDCPQLTTVDGCENVEKIGSSAFNGCDKLSVFPFGNAIQEIESDAFYNCSSLPATLVMPASLTSLGWSGVFNGSSIRSFDLSQCTLTGAFAYNTFGKCTSLLLPEKGDYNLDWEALKDAELKELRLPAALSNIYGNDVFPTTLERLYVNRTEPINVSSNAFNKVDIDNCTLYVPVGSKEAYEEATGWSKFTNVQEQGFKVLITGFGSVQLGGITYKNGDVFFANQGSATTLKLVPENDNEWIAVKLDDTALDVADDGTFTIPEGTTIGTLDISFTSNMLQIDNPNGGELKDKIAEMGNDPSTLRAIKVVGKMATKDWTFIKNSMTELEGLDLSETDLKAVPEGAFPGNQKLAIIHLPSTVTTIDNSAFSYCPQLTTVDGCENVKKIGYDAFNGCNKLSVFPFGNAIQEIGSYAFYNCSSLPATLVLPASLTSLSSYVFYGSSITSFDLSQCTMTNSINDNTFGQCTSLLLPESGDYSLSCNALKDAQLTELRLPAAVNGLSCENALPTTLERLYVSRTEPIGVDNNAFKNIEFNKCTLYVPFGSKETYEEATGWSDFTDIQEQGIKVLIIGFGSVQLGNITYKNGDVFFVNQGNATTLKLVPDNDNEWTAVKLDDTALDVADDGTFTIPEGTTIGTLDISFTSNMLTIDNPNGGELKDKIAEMGNDPSTLRAIKVVGKMATKDWTFIKNSMTELEALDISETDLKAIPEQAFQNHQNLAIIHLPSTVTTIGNSAFSYCPQLTTVDGCENVEEIGDDAFNSCYKLSVFPFGNAIQKIESGAFSNCSSLPATLVMPASLTRLGWTNVFNESSIRSFDLSQCNLTGGFAYNTFGKCTSLLLPEKGDYYMGYEALRDAELKELRLPAALSYIYGNDVLPTTLERLYMSRTEPINVNSSDAFNNIDFEKCTLYVPFGSKDDYEAVTGWSNFTNIQEQGIKVLITGLGSLQQGNISYKNGDFFFANQGSVTTLKLVPDNDNEWTEVKLDDNVLDVANDGTFTIPEGTAIGTLVISFTSNMLTIDNPNGGELKDKIAATGNNPSTLRAIKVVGKMATKDWSFIKNNMPELEALDISETDLKAIPEEALQNHQKLAIIHLPSTVTTISNSAFSYCPQLTTVDGCENVKEIGSSAFSGCNKLSVFPFGNAIQKIESDAFYFCTSLPATLVMPASLKNLGWSGVFNESSIRSFDLSQCTLTGEFSYNTFGKCTSLLLPEKGDYHMAYNALNDAQLTELRLPAAISSIYGENVLPKTLERLYVSRSTPFEVNDNSSFNNIDFDNCTLYVPIGSTEAYNEATGWSNFTNVKEYGLQTVVGEQGKVHAGAQTLMGTTIFFPTENTVTFEIVPNEGWHTDAVTLDDTNVQFADNKFTLSGDQLNGKLAVTFAINQYDLKLEITGNGKVKLGKDEYTASQTLTADHLSTLNFIIEPAAGLAVSSIVFNGKESILQNGGTNYVTPAITANSTLAITFGAPGADGNVVTYAVTTSEGGTVEYMNTTLLPETTIQLPKGKDAVFTMKPEQYYKVDVVKLNGEVITDQLDADGNLTVKDIAADAKLEVTFRINAEITIVMEGGGTLTNLLSDKQKAMVTKLTIKGQMWSEDFNTMRDEMPLLSVIDLWEAEVDYIPYKAFCTTSDWSGNSIGSKSLTSVRLPKITKTISDFAFAGCSNLKVVNFTELTNLEAMYSNAFQNTNLQEIDLRNTKLTEIEGAFRNVKNLETIKFPQAITRLGDVFYGSILKEIDLSNFTNLKTLDGTFGDCKDLVKVTLPEGLTTINNAFYGCEKLATINLPKSLQVIGNSAFSNTKFQVFDLSGLKELQSIGSSAFSGCPELSEVILPASLEQINDYAFASCYKLTSIDLSNTQLQRISNRTFSWCAALKSVKMPKTLEIIGEYAFDGCEKLSGILELGSNMTRINEYAFSNTRISIIRCEATVPPVLNKNAMPETWVAAFVPEGSADAYKEADVWKDMWILDKEVYADVTVSKEGNLAVDIIDQTGLAQATITHLKVHGPLGATDFEIMRSNMTLLYELDMSDAEVSVIPEKAFLNKKVLMDVKLPVSLRRIEQSAFQGCSSLTGTLELPNGLEFIGWAAFQGCSSLDEVVLDESLEVIQGHAFEDCTSLAQEITLPRDFQSLGEYAFANCISLYGTVKFNRDFYMFMGTEGYGSSAGSCFENCSNIETVDMSEPDFLDEIPHSTFSGCTSLKTVLLPPMLERIDNNAFFECTSLDNIEFPNTLLVINWNAFHNCTSLSSLNLSDCKELGTIEGYAFSGCSSLETVYLPKSLNWIRENAFADCRNLANLTVEAVKPADLGDEVFKMVKTDRCVLSIPTGTYYEYLTAPQWGAFVSMRKNIDVTVGDGANLFFVNNETAAARGARRAIAVGQQGAKVKDGSSLYVQENESAIFTLNHDENVEIAKVLFNGKDVTSEMVNGIYETPSVTNASSFEVQVKVLGDLHVKEFRVLDEDITMKVAENRQVRFAVYPTNATNKGIEWTSSNQSVATVNSDGIITGVAAGNAEITGKTIDGGLEKKLQIVIKPNKYWLVMDDKVTEDKVENNFERTVRLPLALHNEEEAQSIQFDVRTPEGVYMQDWVEFSERANGYEVSFEQISNSVKRVKITSQNGSKFEGNEGDLLTLTFATGKKGEDFDVAIRNVHVSGPNKADNVAPNHTIHFNLMAFATGDANTDGAVNAADIVKIVNYIKDPESKNFNLKRADANGDYKVDAEDIEAIKNIIIRE